MAVKHPTLSGRYILGIECDGATYHSARTARERDRLREDVLKQRGWTLYRIWSTDWIKDPVSEGQRLIEAIENALQNYSENEDIFSDDDSAVPSENEILDEIYEQIENDIFGIESIGNEYGFAVYQMAEIKQIQRNPRESDISYLGRIIKHVVEVEGPIHFEYLCKRLAYLFGRERVTAPVRKNIRYVLQNHLRNVVILQDEFCRLKGMDVIHVRVPNTPEMARKIEYISKEEVAEAMYSIVKHKFGLTSEELFLETSRVMGFNRTGGKIKDAMLEALVFLLDNNRVDEKNGKISVKS